MGLPHPRMIEVPLLSPRLSSLWVRFVTRAKWSVAREVVVGLTEDLLAQDDRFWQLIGHPHRLTFAEAARLALDAERARQPRAGNLGRHRARAGPPRALGMNERRLGARAHAKAAHDVARARLHRRCGLPPPPARDRSGSGWPSAAPRLRLASPSSCSTARQHAGFFSRARGWFSLGAAAGGLMAAATYLLYPVLARLVAVHRDRHGAALRGVSRAVAGHRIARALAGGPRRGAGLARRRANGARAAPRTLERRHPGGGRVCARACAARLTRPRGGGAPLRDGLGRAARRDGEPRPTLVAHLVWDVLVLLWLPLDSMKKKERRHAPCRD